MIRNAMFLFFIVMMLTAPVFGAKRDKGKIKNETTAIKKVSSILPKNAKLVVAEPKFQNGSAEEKWIPIFIQGQITTNLQNYSNLSVIDRQNLDRIIAEQRLSENWAESEEEQLKVSRAIANYIVAINLIKKGGNYSIDAKINSAETGTAVGKAYNNPNCPAEKLEDGTEINELCYQLLAGIGIDEKQIASLHNTTKIDSQEKKAAANKNLAKGIVAEKSGGTIVEALAYYQKAVSDYSGLREAASRLDNITAGLSSGNIREQALNEIALRKEWIKIWADFYDFFEKNYYPTIIYSTDIKKGNIDFDKETIELSVPFAIDFENNDLHRLYNTILKSYRALGDKTEKWNIDIEYPPINKSVNVTVELIGENGEVLGSKTRNFKDFKIDYSRRNIWLPLFVKNSVFFDFTPRAEAVTDKMSINVKTDIPASISIDNRKSDKIVFPSNCTFSLVYKDFPKSPVMSIAPMRKQTEGWSIGDDGENIGYSYGMYMVEIADTSNRSTKKRPLWYSKESQGEVIQLNGGSFITEADLYELIEKVDRDYKIEQLAPYKRYSDKVRVER